MITVTGIVFRAVKYGETSLIFDLYTRDKGLVSCIASGVRKRRAAMPPAAFQLMQINQATLYYKEGDGLSRIKEMNPIKLLDHLFEDPVKRLVVTFIAELLQKAIREKEARPDLYDYLVGHLEFFDALDMGVANFHLFFMFDLARHLGFYPIDNRSMVKPYFDMVDGLFTPVPDFKRTLTKEESLLFGKLFDLKRDGLDSVRLSNEDRRDMLNVLIRYYQLHVDGFGKMKSPEILHVILS